MARIGNDLQVGDILTPEELIVLLRIADHDDEKKMHAALVLIRNWRSQGKGPKYYKSGKYVRYYKKDIIEWLENNSKNAA